MIREFDLSLLVFLVVAALLAAFGIYVAHYKDRSHKAKMRSVVILCKNGRIEHGYAKPLPVEGHSVFCQYLIFEAYGVDGAFPNGNPYGWISWRFEDI